jgi:hypothetical protein
MLPKHDMIPSMSRPANPYDNASWESFMKTPGREEIYADEYGEPDHLREDIAAFIDSYYDRVRLHSALGYEPPEEFEQSANPATISPGATMGFFRHEIYRSDAGSRAEGKSAATGSPTIVSISLRLAIPRRVCSPALPASASPAENDCDERGC